MIVPLASAVDMAEFGGKAVQLGQAIRAGLPVPPGYAVSVAELAALCRDGSDRTAQLEAVVAEIGLPVAARSSAVGEDAGDTSFAGQHATFLNLGSAEAILEGLRQVHQSAYSEGAKAYRRRHGVDTPVRIAAVIQKLVDAVCAGVLFTRNPVTKRDELLIEAAWGLGEVVVQGLVTPDQYRLAPDGELLGERAGEKSVAIRCASTGGTEEADVEPALVHTPCLDADHLRRLADLAKQCKMTFGRDVDVEWAFADGALYLLQARPITTL